MTELGIDISGFIRLQFNEKLSVSMTSLLQWQKNIKITFKMNTKKGFFYSMKYIRMKKHRLLLGMFVTRKKSEQNYVKWWIILIVQFLRF